MANWLYKIELNKVLSEMSEKHGLEREEEPCPAEVTEAIATELSKAFPLMRFAPKVKAAQSIAEVNRILARVFDEADKSKVWCGMG